MSTSYLPARLVEGSTAWYVLYYQTNPFTGKRDRFRITNDLNRIHSIRERRKLGRLIVKSINEKLPYGYPYEAAYSLQPTQFTVLEAIEEAKKIKLTTDRKRTRDVVYSTVNIFSEFIKLRKLEELPINEFTKVHALDFLDYGRMERKVSNRTVNNYKERMRALFMELVDRDYMAENPFSGLKKLKEKGKGRRAFNDYEKQVVIEYVAKNDKWLLLTILLQYHCFIRPIEMRRLRLYMINLNEGVINMPGSITKNKENDIVTIPDHLLPILRRFNFQRWNQNYLLLGKGVEPHPSKCCGHNTLNLRHKNILEKLQKDGVLSNIKGLSFYSWKDTGALELFKKKVNILEIMRQLRHKDLSTTQRYCQSLFSVNEEIKALDNSLLSENILKNLLT